MAKKNRPLGGLFLSTPSARRATHIIHTCTFSYAYFYPRPPRGGRHIHDFVSFCIPAFLSTPSARRATRRSCTGYQGQSISIHALREEGDFSQYSFPLDIHDFYPRPPRGGRRIFVITAASRPQFLSTPSARRATTRLAMFFMVKMHFYPRPPRGGRLPPLVCVTVKSSISIHALREEGDLTESFSQKATQRFLSTPSARRATSRPKRCNSSRRISIHALREEGDGLTDRG